MGRTNRRMVPDGCAEVSRLGPPVSAEYPRRSRGAAATHHLPAVICPPSQVLPAAGNGRHAPRRQSIDCRSRRRAARGGPHGVRAARRRRRVGGQKGHERGAHGGILLPRSRGHPPPRALRPGPRRPTSPARAAGELDEARTRRMRATRRVEGELAHVKIEAPQLARQRSLGRRHEGKECLRDAAGDEVGHAILSVLARRARRAGGSAPGDASFSLRLRRRTRPPPPPAHPVVRPLRLASSSRLPRLASSSRSSWSSRGEAKYSRLFIPDQSLI